MTPDEIDELVEAKISEITEILDDYDLFDHDKEAITDIIRELGEMLKEQC